MSKPIKFDLDKLYLVRDVKTKSSMRVYTGKRLMEMFASDHDFWSRTLFCEIHVNDDKPPTKLLQKDWGYRTTGKYKTLRGKRLELNSNQEVVQKLFPGPLEQLAKRLSNDTENY